MSNSTTTPNPTHRGPSLAMLGGVYMTLFVGGLIVSARMAGGTFVSPFETESTILEYFRLHAHAVRVQAFFVFASAIPLGIYAATVVSRLHWLGVRAAGATIALFGGLGASFVLMLSGMAQWVLSHQGIVASPPATLTWQDFAFMTGGPGYASLLGLLIAGVSVPSLLLGLLPRWVCVWGLAVGVFGQLSTLSMIVPSGVYFVPMTRFPGFLWLIVAGFLLPKTLDGARNPGATAGS